MVSLIKNEANRFLPSALEVWAQFADSIVILDDNSSDGSAELCERAGALVVRRGSGECAWGSEAPARQQLFDLAIANSGPGDWLFVLDADMIPARNPRGLLQTDRTSIAFPLFDLWGEHSGSLLYRDDAYWSAHNHRRVWAVQRPAMSDWTWPSRGIHCGHFPLNLDVGAPLFAPLDYGLLHYAYHTPELRREKADRYASVANQSSPNEIAHAQTILDANPRVFPLPFTPEYRLEPARTHERQAA